jgi:hypothetical protein
MLWFKRSSISVPQTDESTAPKRATQDGGRVVIAVVRPEYQRFGILRVNLSNATGAWHVPAALSRDAGVAPRHSNDKQDNCPCKQGRAGGDPS